MKNCALTSLTFLALSAVSALAQVPMNIAVQILKAEDARRYDKTLENLMASPNAKIRKRAALAAGRIGKDEAVEPLVNLLEKDPNNDVRTMAAFALGEIESIKAANAVMQELRKSSQKAPVATAPGSDTGRVATTQAETRAVASVPQFAARLVEAAGKIAAANAKDEKSKALGAAVLNVLESQLKKQSAPDVDVIRLGLTAVLRARPAGAEETVRKFLAYTDPNIVADALNTLARLRAKNANRDARDLLATSPNAIVRANAARVLGAAEDKEAVDVLLKAATGDSDSRVRVSAVRALASLKDAKAAVPLLERGERLNIQINDDKGDFFHPRDQSELLEIATTLGRILANSNDERAITFFEQSQIMVFAPEVEVAFARTAPAIYVRSKFYDQYFKLLRDPKSIISWNWYSAFSQGLGEIATAPDEQQKVAAAGKLRLLISDLEAAKKIARLFPEDLYLAIPNTLRAYSAFKTADLAEILTRCLSHDDVIMRSTAADLLADQPKSKENVEVLKKAFAKSLLIDKRENDAQLAILDALYKLDKKESIGTLLVALDAPDYLVRKKAFELLDDKEPQKDFPGIPTLLENARAKHKDEVLPYSAATGTKLGQVLNTDADYWRALSRKNSKVKAIVTTEKGTFTIDLLPEDAPLTVDNFVKLARANYFNGIEVHRVVPNFVMQDGDPRGDGNGGPGWSIRCEINMVPYERGAVGMALSGKDTGGSQWFVTHSPQRHLDGGYTVFGRVNETGMKVVDNIVRGDRIINVRIIEGSSPQSTRRTPRKR